jgi:hypothetical protein
MADNKDDKPAQTNEAESVKNQERKLVLQRQSAQERLKEIEVETQLLKLDKSSLDNDKQQLELQLEALKLKKQLGLITDQELEKQKQINKEALKRKNLEADLSNELSSQVKSFIGIGGSSTSLLGKMVLIGKEGGNVSLAFADAAKNIASSLTPTNLLAAAVDKVVANTKKLFFDMDKSFSEFEKKAGGVDAFKGRMDDLRRSNVEYGVSIEDAGRAFSDLKTQFAGFAGVSAATQNALADTTAKMEKLGVSSGETIKIQNMLVKGFQMTGEQAGQAQKQLMATAKAMGLPMQQVVKEFANASNGLKAHGANMQKVFIDLQNQSKNLGIEFGRLQEITGKFDTFEGAADAAGQLNAMLGGDYLNSIQLLNTFKIITTKHCI